MITKIKKILSYLGWIIILAMTLSLLSIIITKTITGKPTIFGYMPLFVASESMLPNLKVGDLIIGKPINADAINEGDVVAYKLSSSEIEQVSVTIVHRVVEKTNEGFIFKGDNNKTCDNIVYPEQILYKIIFPNITSNIE